MTTFGKILDEEPPFDVRNVMTSREFENLAFSLLKPEFRDYYRSGADEENTLRQNQSAFDRICFIPTALTNVSQINTEIDFKLGNFDLEFGVPFGLAPCAMHKMVHPDGELATVETATKFKMPMILSTLSSTPIEEVAAHGGPDACLWMQLFIYKDRDLTLKLIHRVEAAGFKGLVLTVDARVFGKRVADWRNRFFLPEGIVLPNFYGELRAVEPDETTPYRCELFAQVEQYLDTTFTWESLDWLRSVTRLPIIVKGILNGADADIAIQHGASAVFVSNHGGRQLDDVPGAIESLPDVVHGVSGRVPIIFDGGVRRGSDILKAMALGANLVMFARPYMYGLTVGGLQGINRALEVFKEELTKTMALVGVTDVRNVSPKCIIYREKLESLICEL